MWMLLLLTHKTKIAVTIFPYFRDRLILSTSGETVAHIKLLQHRQQKFLRACPSDSLSF
jgi:hypothetical protein